MHMLMRSNKVSKKAWNNNLKQSRHRLARKCLKINKLHKNKNRNKKQEELKGLKRESITNKNEKIVPDVITGNKVMKTLIRP